MHESRCRHALICRRVLSVLPAYTLLCARVPEYQNDSAALTPVCVALFGLVLDTCGPLSQSVRRKSYLSGQSFTAGFVGQRVRVTNLSELPATVPFTQRASVDTPSAFATSGAVLVYGPQYLAAALRKSRAHRELSTVSWSGCGAVRSYSRLRSIRDLRTFVQNRSLRAGPQRSHSVR